MLNKPIFISGLRKSGTSLVKNLLDGHPELMVFPPNELHLFRFINYYSLIKDKEKKLIDTKEILSELNKSEFISRINNPEFSEYNELFNVNKFQSLVNNSVADSISDIYEIFFNATLSSIDEKNIDKRFVSKSVLETEYFLELLQWYPDLKFVYVLRNPYGHFFSVKNSIRASSLKNKKISEGDSFKSPYPEIFSEILKMEYSYYFMEKFSRLYPENFYVLIYDNLLQDSERQMQRLSKFLGIDYNEKLLSPTMLGEPAYGNSWTGKKFKEIDKSPITHWQQWIESEKEIEILNFHFLPFLTKMGFEIMGRKKTNFTFLEKFLPIHFSELLNFRVYLSNRMVFRKLVNIE